MGHKRTLLRKQDHQTPARRIGKKHSRWRRCTQLTRGVRGVFERAGFPKDVCERMLPEKLYEVRYHFTKGWRVRVAL